MKRKGAATEVGIKRHKQSNKNRQAAREVQSFLRYSGVYATEVQDRMMPLNPRRKRLGTTLITRGVKTKRLLFV